MGEVRGNEPVDSGIATGGTFRLNDGRLSHGAPRTGMRATSAEPLGVLPLLFLQNPRSLMKFLPVSLCVVLASPALCRDFRPEVFLESVTAADSSVLECHVVRSSRSTVRIRDHR